MMKRWRPDIKALGVEPVQELREQGYLRGLSRQELLDGDGRALPFSDGAFDLVCSFGVLHHVRSRHLVLKEMIRVARTAVLVSDNNIYGDGPPVARLVKNAIRIFGLWKLAVLLRTKGKGHVESDIDGIAYYYSVFDSFDLLKSASSSVHFINTNPWTGVGKNMFWTANNVAVLAILK